MAEYAEYRVQCRIKKTTSKNKENGNRSKI